jgi:hypothetical protein
MAIVKRAGRGLVLGAVAAAMLGVAAGPALATAATWTVTPGGGIMTNSAPATVADTTSAFSFTCGSSSATGSLRTGPGGAGLGTITSWGFSSCTSSIGPFTLTASHTPRPLTAVAYNTTTGVTAGTVTGIHIKLSGPCSAVIDGTSSAAHNGKVRVTYTNSTGALKVLTTGSTLHFWLSTCGNINDGDHAALSASYLVTPKQTITSP